MQVQLLFDCKIHPATYVNKQSTVVSIRIHIIGQLFVLYWRGYLQTFEGSGYSSYFPVICSH
jgi:hypothetical protein